MEGGGIIHYTYIASKEVTSGGCTVAAQPSEHGSDVHADGNHEVVGEVVGSGVRHSWHWWWSTLRSHQLATHQPCQGQPLGRRHGADNGHHLQTWFMKWEELS